MTSVPKTAEAVRRSHANNNKPFRLRYNSKTEGLHKRIGKPIPDQQYDSPINIQRMPDITSTISVTIGTEPETLDPTQTESTTLHKLNIPTLSTTHKSDEKQLDKSTTQIKLGSQDLHKQKEFYKKFEKLQLEQMKAHKTYQRSRVEQKHKHTQMLRDDLPKQITTEEATLQKHLDRHNQNEQLQHNILNITSDLSTKINYASKRRENHRIPQSFINTEPKFLIRKGPNYRTASQKDSYIQKFHHILPPYMYRHYKSTTISVTTASTTSSHEPETNSPLIKSNLPTKSLSLVNTTDVNVNASPQSTATVFSISPLFASLTSFGASFQISKPAFAIAEDKFSPLKESSIESKIDNSTPTVAARNSVSFVKDSLDGKKKITKSKASSYISENSAAQFSRNSLIDSGEPSLPVPQRPSSTKSSQFSARSQNPEADQTIIQGEENNGKKLLL